MPLFSSLLTLLKRVSPFQASVSRVTAAALSFLNRLQLPTAYRLREFKPQKLILHFYLFRIFEPIQMVHDKMLIFAIFTQYNHNSLFIRNFRDILVRSMLTYFTCVA
jgi:hypothetical protein